MKNHSILSSFELSVIENAKKIGIFVSMPELGVTAYAVIHQGNRFIELTLTYCGEYDEWDKKVGQYNAIMNRADMGAILIPYNGECRKEIKRRIRDIVAAMHV